MGTFHTIRIQSAKEVEQVEGLKIFGVRFAKFLPNGWVYKNQLTPSNKLLSVVTDLKKKGIWNAVSFQSEYLPVFLKELKNNPEAKKEFEEIISTLEKGIDVQYACYCTEPKICHRGIIAELVRRKGFKVVIR